MIRAFNRLKSVYIRIVPRPMAGDALAREEGQTFVEYALLITFIAAVALVAVQLLGDSISALFSSVAASF